MMRHQILWRSLATVGCISLAVGLFALASEPVPAPEETEAPIVVVIDDPLVEADLLLAGELTSVSETCIKCPALIGSCLGRPANTPCGGSPACRCSTCGGEFGCHPCPRPPCF